MTASRLRLSPDVRFSWQELHVAFLIFGVIVAAFGVAIVNDYRGMASVLYRVNERFWGARLYPRWVTTLAGWLCIAIGAFIAVVMIYALI